MNKIKQVLSDEGWKSKVKVELWCYGEYIWDLSELGYIQKLCISSSLWSWWSCANPFALCVTATCLMYFNCVCFTVILLRRIALLSILLQTFSGMHPWWILRLYIAFWLTLECVLYLLKFKVYIFVLRTYRCISLALGLPYSLLYMIVNSINY